MGCAIEIVKMILFVFNLIFALCGLGLVGVGVMYKLQTDDLNSVLSETHLTVAPILLIVVGSIIFIISFFGCCGTIRENHCMVVTYATILLSLLIIQIAIGVYMYIDSNGEQNADKLIEKEVKKLFEKSKEEQNARATFGVVEESLHCCGVQGPSDYTTFYLLNNLPKSCCKDPKGGDVCVYTPIAITERNYWTDGCLTKLENLANQVGLVLSIVVCIIIGIEILGIVFALCLAYSIKRSNVLY